MPNPAPSRHIVYIRPERSAVPSRNFGAVDHKLLPIPGERTIEKTDVPEQIQTPHGQISLRKLPDGRFALRNENNDTLIEIVRTRSEEHTSELQSLLRISYAVFCLKKKKKQTQNKIQ